MPFPNEHAARQVEPDKKIFKTFRRTKTWKGNNLPDGVSFIFGIKRKKGPRGGVTQIQSIRFDKNKFTATQAKTWLKKHKFKISGFEKALSKKKINIMGL